MLICYVLAALFGIVPAEGATERSTVLEVDGERVEIVRDRFGVPHVFASTVRSLFYGSGYAVAQDRLSQLERYRRDAKGTLAEVEGQAAVNRDRETRRLGYTQEELQQMFDALQPEHQAVFVAYRDGINGWMREAIQSDRWPDGFKKGNFKPAPWEVTDSVAIAVSMAHRFGSGGAGELRNLRILARLKERFGSEKAQAIFDQLWWKNDRYAPTSITSEDMPAPREAAEPQRHRASSVPLWLGGLNGEVLARAEQRAEMKEIFEYAYQKKLPTKLGSYALVIGPEKSVSGHALVVGGPQMGFMTPQIAHEIHLSGAGFDVIGMGFAGLPTVLIGHNANLAWTTTSGASDLVDIFVEKLDRQDRYRYLYKGEYRDMEIRKETIAVRGGEPVEVEVARTVHGPVLEWDLNAGVAYSISAAFQGKELETIRAMIGFNRAQSVQEFAAYASDIWLTHNFFAADRKGRIGFWHCGKPPLRASGTDHRLPTPGTGEYEWRGYLPFEHVPQVIDPARGFVVNWNNKPAPWWDNSDTPAWGEIFRVERLDELVRNVPKLTVEHVREILIDIGTNDPNAARLKSFILAALERSGPEDAEIQRAADYLRAWDSHADEESVGKTIFDAWFTAIREAIFRDDFGDTLDSRTFEQLLQPSAVLHQLKGAEAGVPLTFDFLNGESRDAVIVRAFVAAVGALKEKNPDMSAWRYHRGNIRFDPLPPIPASNRGTYIQIIELSPEVQGINILPPGQSEDPNSPHYSDQREMAGYWRFKPMLRDRNEIAK